MKFKNSKKQGDYGLGKAISWFTSRGHTVLIPLTDSQPYDLVVDIEGEGLRRVDVKTTSIKHNTQKDKYIVGLKVSGGNRSGTGKSRKFSKTDTDYLFVVTDSGDKYLIPAEELGTSVAVLGPKFHKFKLG